MNLRKLIAPIYVVVLLVHCFLLWSEQLEMACITKILLMPLLLLYLAEALAPSTIKLKLSTRLVALAFLASWGGDIFLLYTGNLFFIGGGSTPSISAAAVTASPFQPSKAAASAMAGARLRRSASSEVLSVICLQCPA